VSSVFVVQTKDLPRAKVGGVDDPSVGWQGAFAAYGGHGTTASSTIVYEIEPGKRLGWHTDRGDAIHPGRHGPTANGGRQQASSRAGQRVRHPDAGPSRPRQYRQGDPARGCLFRGGHVHAAVRQRHAAPGRAPARYPQPDGSRWPAPPPPPPKVAAPLQCGHSNAWTDWQKAFRNDRTPPVPPPFRRAALPHHWPGRPDFRCDE
jgi:hypothetical protein